MRERFVGLAVAGVWLLGGCGPDPVPADGSGGSGGAAQAASTVTTATGPTSGSDATTTASGSGGATTDASAGVTSGGGQGGSGGDAAAVTTTVTTTGSAEGGGGAGSEASTGGAAAGGGGSGGGGQGSAGEGGGAPCRSPPLRECNGVCVDVSMSNVHCGGCNEPCMPDAPNQVAECTEGVCVRTCAPGFDDCGEVLGCRDAESDDDACGLGCEACSADLGQRCIDGACSLDCESFGLSFCEDGASDYCADLVNDPANCGACGSECPGGTCGGGYCERCSFAQPDATTPPGVCAGFGSQTGPTYSCPNMEPGKVRRFRYTGAASDDCVQAFRYVLASDPQLAGGADIDTSEPGSFDFSRDSLGIHAGTTPTMSLNLLWCSGTPDPCAVSTSGVELSVETVP